MADYRHLNMQRAFDRDGRPSRGQYTAHQATFVSRSQPREQTRQAMPGRNSIGGPSRPRRRSQDRPRSVPTWINELPRDYPLPPPERPAPSPRTNFVPFQQRTSVTPSNSISQVDRQSARSFREGRSAFGRDEMPRGTSGLTRVPESQFVNRRDRPGHDQRPNTLYQPSYPPMAPAGPQMPAVVNNYITTNNRQTYNVDNSRHQRVDARGQRNTQNLQYTSTTNTRRDTVDKSRATQRISGASGHPRHRTGRHDREYRG